MKNKSNIQLENDEQNESDIIEKGRMSAVKFKDE